MSPLDHPSELPAKAPDEAIYTQQTNIVRKIGNILGDVVSVGSDIGTETGKLVAYTGNRFWHGMKEIMRAGQHGRAGKNYPNTK